VLLALLGVPILVAIHAGGVVFSTVDEAAHGLQWRARWQPPQSAVPSYFVVEPTAEEHDIGNRGSA
jgi:hypothetical protein